MKILSHLDLCTGIGGFTIAASWAGFETIGFSETEPYCCELLAEKWPLIKNYGDLRRADFSGLRGSVTVLSAGVPCQPSSLAGKRKGAKDDRWLWEAVLDVVGRVQPAWCIFENPPGVLTLDEFGGVLLRLADLGYAVRLFSVPANAVGAKHRRQRVFIMANAGCEFSSWIRRWGEAIGERSCADVKRSGCDVEALADEALAHAERDGAGSEPRTLVRAEGSFCEKGTGFAVTPERTGQRSQAVADTMRPRGWQKPRGPYGDEAADEGRAAQHGHKLERSSQALADAERSQNDSKRRDSQCGRSDLGRNIQAAFSYEQEADSEFAGRHRESCVPAFRFTQPPLCRRADGVPNRSHRLKALGNAVVPQQAYPFFEAIAQVESELP